MAKTINNRKVEYDCDDIFVNRWSPRALTGPITKDELMKCFEAARWAPSSYNEQPWRFVYAIKTEDESQNTAWNTLIQIPNEWNQNWAKLAGALVLVIAKKQFSKNKEANLHALFDTGSAVNNFIFQGLKQEIYVRAMAGIDYKKAANLLNVTEEYQVVALLAVGKHAALDRLPEDLRTMENQSDRKKVSDFTWEGEFHSDPKQE